MSDTTNTKAEVKTEIKKGFQYSPEAKKAITIIAAIVLILPFFIYGVARAYDAFVFNYLESNLNTRVQEKTAAIKNCDDAYTALLRYKQSARVQVTGSGNPCDTIQNVKNDTQTVATSF